MQKQEFPKQVKALIKVLAQAIAARHLAEHRERQRAAAAKDASSSAIPKS